MYTTDKNIPNWGLDRDEFMAHLTLTEEERSLLPTIAGYLLPTGYYHESRMRKEIAKIDGLDATFADFFNTEAGNEYPQIALAHKINAEWDTIVATEAKAYERAETQAALDRYHNRTFTNADLRLLVKRGLAVEEYNDPESNAPTGVHLKTYRDIDGNEYTDQIGLEENPGRL